MDTELQHPKAVVGYKEGVYRAQLPLTTKRWLKRLQSDIFCSITPSLHLYLTVQEENQLCTYKQELQCKNGHSRKGRNHNVQMSFGSNSLQKLLPNPSSLDLHMK